MAKILLVDDDCNIRSIFTEVLIEEGHEVKEAKNGKQCMELAREFQPDVIVLDVFMPEQDGIETLIEIRRERFEARVIACSGGGFRRDFTFLDFTNRFGADVVLRKPILPDQLVDQVRRCLAMHG